MANNVKIGAKDLERCRQSTHGIGRSDPERSRARPPLDPKLPRPPSPSLRRGIQLIIRLNTQHSAAISDVSLQSNCRGEMRTSRPYLWLFPRFRSVELLRCCHDLASTECASGVAKARLFALCSPEGQMRQSRAVFKLHQSTSPVLIRGSRRVSTSETGG